MKKIIIIILSLIIVAVLTLFFWLTPSLIVSKVNESQNLFKVSAEASGGNYLSGYDFKKFKISGSTGLEIFALDDLRVSMNILTVLLGKIKIRINSKEINGFINLWLGGSKEGELVFSGIFFDTESMGFTDDISFSARMSGKILLSDNDAEAEISADDIKWRKLHVAGFSLPVDFFDKAKGGIVVQGGKVIVKALGFEGGRGYARISGEMAKGKTDLTLEIFPKDWDDIYLLPLYEYKVSPGVYKMPVKI